MYRVDCTKIASFEDFIEAFNKALIEPVGGKWNGNLDAFNDYLSWPDQTPYKLEILGASRCAQTLLILLFGVLAGCASTTITLNPSPQTPVCERTATSLVLWAPQWRPDQKDTLAREKAAATGLKNFFGSSGCFSRTELRRIPSLSPTAVAAHVAKNAGQFTRVVVIAVRELGPVVKLLSSFLLVEGGTEVVLRITTYSAPGLGQPREFTVHWRNGGPGVIKGVASLPRDMQAALRAGLKPCKAAR
ncbi:MAG: hypothetical protein CVU65_05445 [Deltaproteobacteria bacterium HGW-Deltaproteobacteria-22]|jgi:hypothetical protein|nr:MAG: hypothetical protein CVU65_05445 [Deltaproteobacteria bacterium HGW-Deltaproteobacteria-22]